MGFGTLFIGYFFLINISNYAYTDIISAMVMLLGLYKLSMVSKNFTYGSFSAIGFTCISFVELTFTFISMFGSFDWIEAFLPYLSSMRFAVIFMITYFILKGIGALAKEVKALSLFRTATASVPLSSVFLIYAAFELPFFSAIFGKYIAYIYFALLLSIVAFIISNLVTIYKAYMQICMPDELRKEKKPSKFEFMNKFYDSMEKKSQKYAEYKLTKQQNKKNKQSKGKK